MQTSAEGVKFIERHEGVVLKAYRDVAGVWTIGAGLTKASGVVVPRAGMTISREDATRLLGEALRRNYEPAVTRAMAPCAQHEFDAGVSFHFNTGGINQASWVKAWRVRNWPEVERRLKLWNKAGGKVWAGLKRRREEEWHLLRYGLYEGVPAVPREKAKGHAVFAVAVDQDVRIWVRDQLIRLGYQEPEEEGITAAAVRAFQRDHALTVDGLIGAATLSTLRRRASAPAKALGPAATSGAAATVTAEPAAIDLAPWVGPALIAVAALWALWRAWDYRDVVAAKIAPRLPGLAARLRSR